MDDRRLQKAFFRQFNRLFMVPAFRLGLGRLVSNPITGYYLVLETRGRRSGSVLSTPVGYAILDGRVYVMAGWGARTNWYLNALADDRVRLCLADGELAGVAREVEDPDERARALRQILKNSGLMAFTEGVNPWRAGDAAILGNGRAKPVMRISRRDSQTVRPGRFDPGGMGWLISAGIAAVVLRAVVPAALAARRRHIS